VSRATLLIDGPGAGQIVQTFGPLFTYQGPTTKEPAHYFRHRVRLLGHAVVIGSVADVVDEAALFAAIMSEDALRCAYRPRGVEEVPGP